MTLRLKTLEWQKRNLEKLQIRLARSGQEKLVKKYEEKILIITQKIEAQKLKELKE